jgi:RNA polymerase sigma-70 factor, ECF subfamily
MCTLKDEIECMPLAALVPAAAARDRDAQCALYRRYYQSALAVAYQFLGNWDEAEELVQDGFIQAFERLDQLRVPEAFGGWLRQIIRRMALNLRVRNRMGTQVEIDSLDVACSETATPLDDVLDRERRQQVHVGLQQLTDLDRSTLEAFYLGGESLIEMSERFDAPVGTIKRRLHIARKRLAAQIGSMQAI